MFDGSRVAVIVPAYNEEQLIAKTLSTVPDFVDWVFVIDDASADATAETARALGQSRVRVIRHDVNRGVGAAIVTGYRAALDAGADVLAVMAGDAHAGRRTTRREIDSAIPTCDASCPPGGSLPAGFCRG
jgi:glycosyltransferase involved in cell wall biosynthesis